MECRSQSDSIREPVNASSVVSYCQLTFSLNLIPIPIIVILLEMTISIGISGWGILFYGEYWCMGLRLGFFYGVRGGSSNGVHPVGFGLGIFGGLGIEV